MTASARRLQERRAAANIAQAAQDAFSSLAHKLEFAESVGCAFALDLARRHPEVAEEMGTAWIEALCALRDAATEIQNRKVLRGNEIHQR